MKNSLNNETNQQLFTKIKVESRIVPYASYVNYEIIIETNDPSFTFESSSTHRRYSDFRILRTMLVKNFPCIQIPELPPKSPFKKSFDMEFVEKRRTALEEFLAKLLSKKIVLSSRAFHLFLQSSYPMAEIKNIVEGKPTDIDVNWPGIVNESTLPLKGEEASMVNSEDRTNSACAEPTTSFASCSNSPLGCKRVSFCDQVTVAEIHST